MRFWAALAFRPPEQLVPLARAAEAAGFHGVTLPDHLFVPTEIRSRYPYSPDGVPPWPEGTPWPDPWVSIGAMAAVTTRLRFTTNVYVAPARDVFSVAKVVATASAISGGRVALGCAAGWMREEYLATGQDFATRGRRLDEMITALRALWMGGPVQRPGELIDFRSVDIAVTPPGRIPIYVGGESPAALRRAVLLGDGWIGNALLPEAAFEMLATLRGMRAEESLLEEPFEVILAVLARPDRDLYARLEAAGLTGFLVAPGFRPGEPMPPLGESIAAIERFGEQVIAPFAGV